MMQCHMQLAGWCSVVVHRFSKSSRSSSDDIRRLVKHKLTVKYCLKFLCVMQLAPVSVVQLCLELDLADFLVPC